MADWFHAPINRQRFLRYSLGACGALWLGQNAVPANGDEVAETTEPAGPSSQPSLHLALLSDTHIPVDVADGHRGFRPYDNLLQIVPQIVAQAPEAAIINGDAARLEGKVADYQQLKQLLTPLAELCPIGIGMGNHDDRRNFAQVFDTTPAAFAKAEINERHVLTIDHPIVRVVVLDSLLYVNEVAGLLGKSQRAWLAKFLTDQDNRPTVLFVHHTLGDDDGELLDVDRLFEIVQPHVNVKAIFFGHSHRYSFERRGRLHLVNLPAVGYNFADDQPVGWVDSTFTATGCALTLHTIAGNQAANGTTIELQWLG